MSSEAIKKTIGSYAAGLVQDHMLVGLGTGSTAICFIETLLKRVQNGLKIQAVATSNASYNLAKSGGIPLLDINEVQELDITFDGADAVDPEKRIIKGAGGALLREKIIACMSKKLVILIDESKLVDNLEKCPLPIEIIPFGIKSIENKLNHLGFFGMWRKTSKNEFYVTDNGNFIYDVKLNNITPEKAEQQIFQIAGVVETGLFLNMAASFIIGKFDGTIVTK